MAEQPVPVVDKNTQRNIQAILKKLRELEDRIKKLEAANG